MADDLSEPLPQVGLRPVTPDDRDFLLAVYASTRDEELRLVPWSDVDRAAFISMQFEAQDAAYRATYPDARFLIITSGDDFIGRLYLARLADEIRVIDIAILPGHRGAGIGTRLLKDVLAEAARDGLPVRLHVERRNPARALYERLGFRPVGGDEVYERMECLPSMAGTPS